MCKVPSGQIYLPSACGDKPCSRPTLSLPPIMRRGSQYFQRRSADVHHHLYRARWDRRRAAAGPARAARTDHRRTKPPPPTIPYISEELTQLSGGRGRWSEKPVGSNRLSLCGSKVALFETASAQKLSWRLEGFRTGSPPRVGLELFASCSYFLRLSRSIHFAVLVSSRCCVVPHPQP